MKVCLNATWEEFILDVDNCGQGVTLFGASSCGKRFLEQNRTFQIDRIIDNDEKKWGKAEAYNNIPVEGIDVLKEYEENSILLITSTWYLEIVEQLKEFGYKGKVYSFLRLKNAVDAVDYSDAVGYSTPDEIKMFEEHIDQLKLLLADDESKKIVDAILEKRKNRNFDYTDIQMEDQYFISDVVPVRDDAVYVDGGAYDGDTVRKFIEYQNGEFDKIYVFEMDAKNFAMIDRTAFDERVEFFNYGLWREKSEMSYMAADTGSNMCEMGNNTAKVVSLDEVLHVGKVTLIKMDIEGAEIEALRGSEQIIKKWHPDCAICVYHKPRDIWEIPFLLHSMVEDYSLYIRHHGNTIFETVLYAIAKR